MAVALVRRTTVCALIVALAATGACGGGGEGRQIDAGQDKAAGDVPITIVDSGPDKPSKGLGEQCATPSECSSAQCVEGVCCDQACGDACFTCKNPGTEGICFPALPGTDPGDRCPTQDATSCGTTGVCDGTGACARYSGNAGVVCADEACVGFMRTTTGTCDSAGGCSGASTQSCTPYQCATDGKTCRTSCMTDADCVSPNTCVNNSCGKKPLGARLRRRRRMQFRDLRAGTVLLGRLHGDVQVVRGGGQRGNLPKYPRRHGSPRPVRRRGRDDLRARRAVQRRGRVPQVRGQHDVRDGFVQRGRRAPGRALRCHEHVRARDAPIVQPVRVRHDELQDQLREQRRLRRGVHVRRQRLHAAVERHAVHQRRDVHVRLLRAGRLLQHRLRGGLRGLQPDG